MLMLIGPTMIAMFIFMKESNHPTILAKKAARLRKELGRDDLRSQLQPDLPPREILIRAMIRPIKVGYRAACQVECALRIKASLQITDHRPCCTVCKHNLWNLMYDRHQLLSVGD
jgi:hypothetical protein